MIVRQDIVCSVEPEPRVPGDADQRVDERDDGRRSYDDPVDAPLRRLTQLGHDLMYVHLIAEREHGDRHSCEKVGAEAKGRERVRGRVIGAPVVHPIVNAALPTLHERDHAYEEQDAEEHHAAHRPQRCERTLGAERQERKSDGEQFDGERARPPRVAPVQRAHHLAPGLSQLHEKRRADTGGQRQNRGLHHHHPALPIRRVGHAEVRPRV
mmetsp:Transcript_12450/g.33868  ORF Transcript_12450/g.33868 Transcript_12450/m.33868 type:complete len:211 (+) Transcript_12450:678-1310(+)